MSRRLARILDHDDDSFQYPSDMQYRNIYWTDYQAMTIVSFDEAKLTLSRGVFKGDVRTNGEIFIKEDVGWVIYHAYVEQKDPDTVIILQVTKITRRN